MHRSRIAAAAGLIAAFAFAGASVGCREEGPAERAGKALDEAAEDAQEGLEDLADQGEGAFEDAGEAVDEAIDDAGDALEDAGEAAEETYDEAKQATKEALE
jgi:hypothetical protein